jgi:hypothetical protein
MCLLLLACQKKYTAAALVWINGKVNFIPGALHHWRSRR